MKHRHGLVAALGLWLTACGFESKGAEELIGSGVSYVNFPGTRWLSGHFTSARFDGKTMLGEYLTALDDGGELIIVKAGETAACSVGPAVAYRGYWSGPVWLLDSEQPPLVAFLSSMDADGRGELKFASPDCSVWSSGLMHAELPRFFGGKQYLVRDTRDDGDALVAVDPWNEQVADLETQVSQISQDFSGTLNIVAGGRLTVRDADWTPHATATDVSNLVVLESALAFQQAGSVVRLDRELGTFTSIAEDGCELRATAGSAFVLQTSFTFSSPCDSAALKLYDDRNALVYALGEPGMGKGAHVARALSQSEDRVFVLTDPTDLPAPDARSVGALWHGLLGADPARHVALEKLADSAMLPALDPYPYLDVPLKARFIADFDGNSGRLLEARGSDASVELAAHVREFDGNFAIFDVDSGPGNLLATFFQQPETLALGVSSLSFAKWLSTGSGYALAVVREGGERIGSLQYAYLKQESWADPSKVHLQMAAESVLARSVGWLDFGALGYLRDYDETLGSGVLSMRFVDSKDTFERVGVSAWREATLGQRDGVLYIVADGADAGVWFAEAR